jgi:hypothetical protein
MYAITKSLASIDYNCKSVVTWDRAVETNLQMLIPAFTYLYEVTQLSTLPKTYREVNTITLKAIGWNTN